MTRDTSIVWASLFGAALSLVVAGCDCAGPSGAGVCDGASRPVTCGRACSVTAPCPGGFFCGTDGTCSAQCSSTVACAGGGVCTAEGRCIGGTTDSGTREAGPDVGPVDAPGPDNTCASVDVGATLATPNVILIVDQSGSMGDNEFPAGSGTSRWDAVDHALLDDPAGLVPMLQNSVRFGLACYHGGSGCPRMTTVPAELMQFPMIQSRFDSQDPGGDTPTGMAIDYVLDHRAELVTHPEEPTIFVLATDGEPDTCLDGDDEVGGRAASVAAVERAFSLDIETFVISVGVDVSNAHLQDLANAGVGATGTDAPFYVATDTAALSAALGMIVGGVVSCDVRLDGMIDPEAACTGEVRLGGRVLPCDDPNGWHAVDATHIEITGTACDELLDSGGGLTASFPCGVLVI
jgi:hypothetical protein